MPLTVLTGGARSGKSDLAVQAAVGSAQPVTFIATAEARDTEFAARIARHRRARPAAWGLIEEPLALGRAIKGVDPQHFLIVDCLSLWVSNLNEQAQGEAAIVSAARAAAEAAAVRPGETFAVTNEVGWGIVPDNALARSYRDVLGRVNREFVAASERAWLVAAGRAVPLAPWSFR